MIKEIWAGLFCLSNEKLENNNLKEKKETLLAALKTEKGYKRCITSPLRYAGGKSLAVGYILEQIPNNIERLVSPFFGGGSVEIAFAKYLGLEIIGYDIFDILVNYWQWQIKNPEAIYEKLKDLKPNKEEYQKIKEKLKDHWNNNEKLNPLDLAVCYYFNHNLSYGPGFLGWMSKIYENNKKYLALLDRVKNFKTEGKITVDKMDFKEAILKHKNDFLYLDPPYFLDGDSKMFRGIYPQRNFPIHHNNFKHELLRDLLKQHKGGFVLSYNDCETTREWYKEYKIVEVAWQYTMGQGETRIGLNRKKENRVHVKKSHEILIVGEK